MARHRRSRGTEQLAACAKAVKTAHLEFRDETQVTVTASPGVALGTIMGVVDALRADGETPLFPEVHFGVVR